MNSSTIARLDRIFSEYIRLRDADKNGYVRCISCRRVRYWKEVDCGHYISRRHLSTRWNEKNCNGQCMVCNRMKDGNVKGYTQGIVKKYGQEILDELAVIKHTTSKLTNFEGEQLIKHYKEQVNNLKKSKAA